jgi:hypothetical protein
VHAIRGAVGGNMAGSVVDTTIDAFGGKSNGRFARMGTYAGGGLGLMRGGGTALSQMGGKGTAGMIGRDMQAIGRQGTQGMSNFVRGSFDPIVAGGRKGLNWLTGGRFQSLANPTAAARAATPMARRLGQVAGGATLAGTGIGLGMNYLDNKFNQKAQETMEAGLGAIDEYADAKFDQYTQQAPAALARGAVNMFDPMFQAAGMNAAGMHPMQKAMMLGGAGVGAFGAATGNPWAMGAGALMGGGGYMANRFNPLTGGYDGSGGQGGNWSSDRNELAHQQMMQQRQQPQPPAGNTGQGWM